MPRRSPSLDLRRFTPRFSDEELGAFQAALAAATLVPETYASTQPRYGITHAWMTSALAYWKDAFDWRQAEKAFGEDVDHYMVTVDSSEVHFVAHFSEDPKAIPLLLLHGWPGSFLEFIPVIKLLRESTNPSFHLVCPSQPGFPGWSSPPPLDRPYGLSEVAKLMDAVMVGVGFGDGYAAQGGDIGSVIGRLLAVHYPACKALNVNYLPLLPPSSILPSFFTSTLPNFLTSSLEAVAAPVLGKADTYGLTPLEIANARKVSTFISTGRGYGVMHGTRPATIGIVIGSSPVALLAWLGEKFRDWTDDDLPLDVVLESVTLWWLSKAFPTSIYAYAELTGGVGPIHRDPTLFVTKPFGFSSFAHEIASAPKLWAAQTGNLMFYKYHEKGGHFAALERPKEFAEDMRECFGKIYLE